LPGATAPAALRRGAPAAQGLRVATAERAGAPDPPRATVLFESPL
jgi:hypothetical protein